MATACHHVMGEGNSRKKDAQQIMPKAKTIEEHPRSRTHCFSRMH